MGECARLRVYACMRMRPKVQVWRTPVELVFSLYHVASWGVNSSHQLQWQTPLPAKSFYCPQFDFLKNAQIHHFEYKILKNFDVCVTKKYFAYVILCGVYW